MSAWVRTSKVRNVGATIAPPTSCYTDLSPGQVVGDTNMLAASTEHLAYVHSSNASAVAVLPISQSGRLSFDSHHHLSLLSHPSPISAFEFSHHDAHSLLTLTNDGRLNCFSTGDIFTGGDDDGVTLRKPLKTLQTTVTKPSGLLHHPSAANIVAVRGGNTLAILDTNVDTPAFVNSSVHTDTITSFDWTLNGSTIFTCCADKSVKIFDPRDPTSNPLAIAKAHTGLKGVTVKTFGSHQNTNTDMFVTCGQTAMRDREFALWDLRNLELPAQRERLDTSNGMVTPLFDPDTNLLFLCGKGDMNVRMYELEGAKLLPINNVAVGGDSQRSVCLMPKRSCDLMQCEVARILKLTDHAVQPINFKVPRRDKTVFVQDLYPESNVYEAAISAADYLGGADAMPKKGKVTPGKKEEKKEAACAPARRRKSAILDPTTLTSSPRTSIDGAPPTAAQLDYNVNRENRSSTSTSSSSRFSNGASKFRHVFGKASSKRETYFNLTPNISTMDTSLLAGNDQFFAMPWKKGAGKELYVSRLDNYGKVEPDCSVLITGHSKAIGCLRFSPWDPSLLVTGGDDCKISIFRIGDDATLAGGPDLLEGHRNSVRSVDFNPCCENVLMSSGLDLAVKLWDINSQQELIDVGGHHEESINNCCWDYFGKQVVTASRDKMVRIIDPLSNTVVHKGKAHSGARGPRVTWCRNGRNGRDCLLTVGNGISGDRQLCLWDPRDMSKAYCTKTIDNGNGIIFPMYDESTGMAYLCGRGDRNIKYFEIAETGPDTMDALPCHEIVFAGDPTVGVVALPSTGNDVKGVEVMRVLRLAGEEVVPASFTLPRNKELSEFFQDDIFGEVRAMEAGEGIDVEDWKAGKGDEEGTKFKSLRPEGMPLLSERVEVRVNRAKTQVFKAEIDFKEKEDKQKNDMFKKMQGLAVQHEAWNPNASMGASKGANNKGAQVGVTLAKKAGCDATPIYDTDSDGGWSDED